MRRSSTLPLPTDYPWSTGLCRLLSAPAGRRTFPTLCCASFPACLDPYPGGSCGARTRFFPHASGLPPVRTGSALHNVRTATSVRRVFRGCSHSLMFRPTGLLATPVAPTDISLCGSRGFSVRASHGLLPPRAPDMLTVRIGPLTVWGLSPHQIRSLVGCSPNAAPQDTSAGTGSLACRVRYASTSSCMRTTSAR